MNRAMIIIAVFLCFGFSSCNKNKDSHCVNSIQSSPKITLLSESEMEEIKYLFNYNQLDYTKYLFTRYTKDELGYKRVRCYQFANNLRVFSNELIFPFDMFNNYSGVAGNIINEINLDTKPLQEQDEVVDRFIEKMNQDEEHIKDKKNKKTCFNLEFGYYDLNAGTGDTNKIFTKAWKIESTNNDYPFAYINDNNLEIIYYDNGIRY
jgi:Zn-dependent metalloprotease